MTYSDYTQAIFEYVDDRCTRKYSDYSDYTKVVSGVQLQDIPEEFESSYILACKTLTYGLIRFSNLDSEKRRARLSKLGVSSLVVLDGIDAFISRVFGCTVTTSMVSSVLGLPITTIKIDDTNDQTIYTKISEVFDTILILLNCNVRTKIRVMSYDTELGTLYNRLEEIVKHNSLSDTYGVLVQAWNGGKNAFLTPTDTGELGVNYIKLTDDPLPIEEQEHNLGKLFDSYLTSAGCTSFIFTKSDKGYQVSIPNNKDKVLYYPIFIASLVFRRRLECVGGTGTWRLVGEKMTVDGYLKDFLFDFFYDEFAEAILSNLDQSEFTKQWSFVVKSLTAYVYLQDFKGAAKGILTYHLGGKSDDNSQTCERITKALGDTSESGLGSRLFGGQTIQVLSSGFFGKSEQDYAGWSVVFTADMVKYNSLTSFAYKTYAQLLANGSRPSPTNLFLGMDLSDQLLRISLGSATAYALYLASGSRSGKGVLVLNILAGLVGSGNFLMYFDNKPDMAATLWHMEKVYNARNGVTQDLVPAGDGWVANPQYKRILSIECQDPNYVFCDGTDTTNVFGRNSTRVRLAYKKGWGNAPQAIRSLAYKDRCALAYAKALQLAFIIVQNPLIFGLDDKYLVTVLDELKVGSDSLRQWFKLIGSKISIKQRQEEKAFYDISTKEDKLSDDGRVLSTYLNFFNDITATWNGGKNAFFTKKGQAIFIEIAQKMVGNMSMQSDNAPPKSLSYIAQMVDDAPLAIYGRDANITKSNTTSGGKLFSAPDSDIERANARRYVEGGQKSSDKATGATVTASADTVSRAFIFSQGAEYRVFKPLFTLNENDFCACTKGLTAESKANGGTVVLDNNTIRNVSSQIKSGGANKDTAVGGFLAVQHELGFKVEDVLKSEILSRVNGQYVLKEEIGFGGLLEMLMGDSNTVLNTLSAAYDMCWKVLELTGLASNYSFVEEYLYDFSPESVHSTSELLERIQNGGTSGDTNSQFDDDFDSQEYGGMPEADFGDTEGFDGTSNTADSSDRDIFSNSEDEPTWYGSSDGQTEPIMPVTPSTPTPSGGTTFEDDDMFDMWEDDGSGDSNSDGGSYSPSPTPSPLGGNSSNAFDNSEGTPSPIYPDDAFSGPVFTEPFINEEVDDLSFGNGIIGDHQSMCQLSLVLCECIGHAVGSKDRVMKLEIEDGGKIYVNGIYINPSLTSQQLNSLPMDIVINVKRGAWADLFNFKDLYHFKKLSYLRIDDRDIVELKLRHEMNIPKDWLKLKNKLLRHRVPISTLIICGQEIIDAPEVVQYQQEESERYSFIDGCKRGFSGLATGAKWVGSTFKSIHASKTWNSKPVRFLKGMAKFGLGVAAFNIVLGAFGIGGLLWGALAGTAGYMNMKRGK